MDGGYMIGIGELAFVSLQEDEKAIVKPAHYRLYRVAMSMVPGLRVPPGLGAQSYLEDVISNEASSGMSHRFNHHHTQPSSEVFEIHSGETYEIWVDGTKRVAFQGPSSDLLDRGVFNPILP